MTRDARRPRSRGEDPTEYLGGPEAPGPDAPGPTEYLGGPEAPDTARYPGEYGRTRAVDPTTGRPRQWFPEPDAAESPATRFDYGEPPADATAASAGASYDPDALADYEGRPRRRGPRLGIIVAGVVLAVLAVGLFFLIGRLSAGVGGPAPATTVQTTIATETVTENSGITLPFDIPTAVPDLPGELPPVPSGIPRPGDLRDLVDGLVGGQGGEVGEDGVPDPPSVGRGAGE